MSRTRTTAAAGLALATLLTAAGTAHATTGAGLAAEPTTGPTAGPTAEPTTAPDPTLPPTPQRVPDEPPGTAYRKAKEALAHPTITWRDCEDGLQCGEMDVPVDYSDLWLGVTRLTFTKRVADQPQQRIGSLFVNPGGPGFPASPSLPTFVKYLGAKVTSRFDVVAMDPRGMSGTDKVVCTNAMAPELPKLDLHAFPLNLAEMQQQMAWDRVLAKKCFLQKLINHMTTADVARDMDLARRAVGDKQLTYYGVSYGSYLGATYAALFPSTFRALVVDGTLDPIAWSTGHGSESFYKTVDERTLSDEAAVEALDAAMRECETSGVERCPEAKTIREDWRVLAEYLRKQPLDLGDGQTFRYDDLFAQTFSVFYRPQLIPPLFTQLHELREAAVPTTPVPAPVPTAALRGDDATSAADAVAAIQELVPEAEQSPIAAPRPGPGSPPPERRSPTTRRSPTRHSPTSPATAP